ncbi:hypothetical protein QBC43DRAFT_341973 [Cladorrhinum sp. PSN259]|nr:hypothetical protein QBC43DRAFT_341973 [Cladorrhinum sp. PSN259]
MSGGTFKSRISCGTTALDVPQQQPFSSSSSDTDAVPTPDSASASASGNEDSTITTPPSSGPTAATIEVPAPASAPAPDTVVVESEQEQQLPPLTPEEFRIYNRLSDQMEYFHSHFRSIHQTLYQACLNGKRPANMSLKQFLDEGLRLTHYLDAHHSIEETHLYPILARKMPQFRSSSSSSSGGVRGSKKGKEENELLRQHRDIHRGMDGFEEYIRRCKRGEIEFEMGVMRDKMEGWREVLMRHLDEEVEELGAEKMRRVWSLEEVRAFPI